VLSVPGGLELLENGTPRRIDGGAATITTID